MTAILDDIEATRIPLRYEDEQEARQNYARWFTKKYYLDKTQLLDVMAAAWYEMVQRDKHMIVVGSGAVRPWQPLDYFGGLCSPSRAELFDQRCRVNIADLEATDDNPKIKAWSTADWFTNSRRHYATAKVAWEHNRNLSWLRGEAEYHTVYNEALVRSFGIDVTAL